MNEHPIRKLLCLIIATWGLCCINQSYAEGDAVPLDPGILGAAFAQQTDAECKIYTQQGLFFSPECGTLFQWSEGASCSGGPQLDEPLVTDRPNFTSTSVTVGKGVTQIEFGYTYLDSKAGGLDVRYQSFGEFLFRQGILVDWLEFRIDFSPLQQSTEAGTFQNTTFGTQDLDLALQFALTPQAGLLPEMAIIVSMSVPTGSPAFTSNQVDPGIDWIYSWNLNDFLSIDASTQGYRTVDNSGQSYLEFAQSCSVGYTLSKKLGAFTEWFALIPSGATTAQTQHYFDAGFTYLINNNLQLDVSAGVGLNDAADGYFMGAGCSIRFP
ncbi:MAG: transporter [Planctomycetota bacterium]